MNVLKNDINDMKLSEKDHDSVTNELKVKIDNVNNLLKQQQQVTDDKSRQISNLTSQVTKQQNDIKNLTNQMKKYKNDINAMVEQKHNEVKHLIKFPPFEWDPPTKPTTITLSNFNKFLECTTSG
eukprot:314523_1